MISENCFYITKEHMWVQVLIKKVLKGFFKGSVFE